jgi:hypothetical protein
MQRILYQMNENTLVEREMTLTGGAFRRKPYRRERVVLTLADLVSSSAGGKSSESIWDASFPLSVSTHPPATCITSACLSSLLSVL